MEEAGMGWEQSSLLNELTQGKDLAKQLQTHLNPSSSTETRLFIVEKILRSYEKALSMLNSGALAVSMLESPPSAANSTLDSFDHKDISKKRKTMSKWTEHVRVCAGSSRDVPLEDGYGWRKYGQKDILGTNYPRAYYRCTHRHSQGCLATKQVQRSDDDPTLFEVTYRGRHTCIHSSRSAAAPVAVLAAAPSVEEDPKEKPEQPEVMVLNFETEPKVKAESSNSKEEIFPSFPFPYASTESEEVGNDIFPESMVDNNLMGSFSPAFISPATSESNYFSVSPCHMGSFGIVQASESDLAEIISGPASVTNSPIGDLDFTVVFDTNFSFDNLDYFS